MAGMQVPLVLIPRYTTYCGASGQSFETIGMDVTEYEQANVSLWRTTGKDLTTFALDFQESMDQLLWSSCSGGPFVDPGATTEGPFQPVFTKRWFRLVITITGTSPVVTCWCLGFLVQRES